MAFAKDVFHLGLNIFQLFMFPDLSIEKKESESSLIHIFFSSTGHVGLLPRGRVFSTLVFWLSLAAVIMLVTKDEFLFGRIPEIQTAHYVEPLFVDLSFEEVTCIADGGKTILKNASGRIPSGEITAILGPSGAGKSTLASLLLGRGERICVGGHSGIVALNGHQGSLNSILDRVGYVPQFDNLFEDLSVEETLVFSGSWRLPGQFDLEGTLEVLELTHLRNQPIHVLSGGEKKRVSIGVEMIANPSVLVMDEPTSGLDAAAAFLLMKKMRDICDKKGVSIVVVLHAPSMRVYEILDNLVLLQKSKVVFVGPKSLYTISIPERILEELMSEKELPPFHYSPQSTSLGPSHRLSQRPGLLTQNKLWLSLLLKINYRKSGFFSGLFAVVSIGGFSGWVRSYARQWDSRPLSSFFVSLTVFCQASFGAVFQDFSMPPVKRAADSGMILGAHHNALCVYVFVLAYIYGNFFALVYSFVLKIRRDSPFDMKRHFELVYIYMIGYLASWSYACLFCVLAKHDFQTSAIWIIGFLITTHVFSRYSPNARQIELDSFILEKYNIGVLVKILCKFSPVRYFIEGFTVWDAFLEDEADEKNDRGRNFMLNYFQYRHDHKSQCFNELFRVWVSNMISRWFMFGFFNSTDFHDLYDKPLFLYMMLKLQLSWTLAVLFIATLHYNVVNMDYVDANEHLVAINIILATVVFSAIYCIY